MHIRANILWLAAVRRSGARLMAGGLALLSLLSTARAMTILEHLSEASQETLRIGFASPEVVSATPQTVRLRLADTDERMALGEPILPQRALRLPVPDGYGVAGVRVSPRRTTTQRLPAPLEHAQAPHPLSRSAPAPMAPDAAIYASDTPFPALDPALWRVDRLHGAGILTIVLYPVQYQPPAGLLLVHRELTVTVDWTVPPPVASSPRTTASAPGAIRTRPGDRQRIQSLLDVPLPLAGDPAGDAPIAPQTGTLAAGAGLLRSEDIHYAIVAPASLLATPPPHNLQALAAHRQRSGMTVTNVPLEWILATYDGTRPDGAQDDATRLRNFVIEAYAQWGLRYLVLAGNRTHMPYRSLYNQVVLPTFTYTAHIPSDLYFGALDGDFDGNADGRYGERNDGPGGGDVDLLAEVYVGRLLVSSTTQVARVVQKTIRYETAPPEDLRRILHVGEHLGFGGVSEYAKPSLEEIRLGGAYNNYATVGFVNFPHHDDFDTDVNLYDMDATWSKEQLLALWQQGPHVINHLGHGSHASGLRLSPADLAVMPSDPRQPLLYSQACELARYDDVVNGFGEILTTAAGGASAAVLNTRYGWGRGNTTDGPSQRYHRRFWDQIFDRSAYTFGQAVQHSRERLISSLDRNYPGDPMRWCYYAINLFGDPATPFARRVRQERPVFDHRPLQNHYPAQTVRLSTGLGPESLVDADTVTLLWRTQDDAGVWRQRTMPLTASHRYAFDLPPLPLGTLIDYQLRAISFAGLSATEPEDGIESFHTFAITPALQLLIEGHPSPFGTVSPAYGWHELAEGYQLTAAAPTHTTAFEGTRQALAGWTGTGSVPASGTSNRVDLVLETDSSLTWQWNFEHALTSLSDPTGLLTPVTVWTLEDETADTPTAPASILFEGSTYQWAQWEIDGQRRPAPGLGAALNPVADIVMTTPRTAVARYLPAAADSAGNGIADWWELRYFGYIGIDPAADPDGDGYDNLEEFLARTDPLDPESIPGPPVIRHEPLTSPQPTPTPFAILAAITDPHRISMATLSWSRNGGAWRQTTLEPIGQDLFLAAIDEPAGFGDHFLYLLVASNPAGYTVHDGPYAFELAYPEAGVSPAPLQTLALRPDDTTYPLVTVSNRGNVLLEWTWRPGLFEDFDHPPDGLAPGWTPDALDQNWVRVSTRFASAPYAMYSHLKSQTPPGDSALRAALDSPPLTLAAHARLRFRYWMRTEHDVSRSGYVWDGGILEISTDDGASFQQLPGPYSHKISGWSMSPWPDGTPCFGGDSGGWQDAEFDLTAFAGETVVLRFHHGADNNTDFEGWYLDDIEVGPLKADWPAALQPARLQGSLAPGALTQEVFRAEAAGLDRPDSRLPRYLCSNDPLTPVLRADALLLLRHPPWIETLAAAQTATQGEGTVTIEADLIDLDGEICALEVHFSDDAGLTWRRPALTAVSAAVGTPRLTEAGDVADIATRDAGGQLVTNRLTLTWDTQAPAAIPGVSLHTLVRAQARDVWFESLPVPSAPFMVDNQPPPAVVPTSQPPPAKWYSNRVIRVTWPAVSDGIGSGLAGYRVALSLDPEAFPETGLIPERDVLLDPGQDGSNFWVRIVAEDRVGNRSTPALRGPFWIDATPPSIAQAVLVAQTSAYGPYAIGPTLSLSGYGFSDALSGIAAYELTRTAPLPACETVDVSAFPQTIATPALDQENRFDLRARDRAGNLSAPVSTVLLVLDPDTDFDGDGMTAAEEEIAGTDATDPESLLWIDLRLLPLDRLQLTWPGAAQRYFTLEHSSSLAPPDWTPLPGWDALPGSGGIMTGEVSRAGAGYFRVRAAAP